MAKNPMESSFHSKRWFRKFSEKHSRHPSCSIRFFHGLTSFYSMAPLVYSSEGQEIRSDLWKETMAELSFAQVEAILKDIST